MKRSWIGAAVLLVLLAVSLCVTWAMDAIHDPIEESLDQAARYALRGDWERSTRSFRKARDSWEKWDRFRSCFADHTPVEQISADFRELEVYCAARVPVEFAAHCRGLARKTAAVGEAHTLVWWNLF